MRATRRSAVRPKVKPRSDEAGVGYLFGEGIREPLRVRAGWVVQCREGWHLEDEPIPNRPTPTAGQKALLAVRADLHAAYRGPWRRGRH